jgi:hypothetical protein
MGPLMAEMFGKLEEAFFELDAPFRVETAIGRTAPGRAVLPPVMRC